MTDSAISPYKVDLPTVPVLSPDEAKKLLQPQDYLKNLTLCSGQSGPVTAKKAHPGDFWFDPYNLGTEATIVAFCYRWHAILFENNKKKLESFKHDSPATKQIQALRRSGNEIMPRHGYSWLIYIPQLGEIGIFHPAISSQWEAGWDMYMMFTPPANRDEQYRDMPHTKIWKLGTIERLEPVKHNRLIVSPGDQAGLKKYDAPDKEKLEEAVKKFYMPVKMEPEISDKPSVER